MVRKQELFVTRVAQARQSGGGWAKGRTRRDLRGGREREKNTFTFTHTHTHKHKHGRKKENKQAGRRMSARRFPRAATPLLSTPCQQGPLSPCETRPVILVVGEEGGGHSSRETSACLFRIGLNGFRLRTDTWPGMRPSPSPSFAAYLHALARPRRGARPRCQPRGLGQCCPCGWIVPGLEPTPGITDEVISILGALAHPHPFSPAPLLD